MRNTFRILFYINRQKARKDGRVPILCRITIDRAVVSISTKLSCNPEGWDARAGSSPEVASALEEFREQIHQTAQALLDEEGYITPLLIKERLSRKDKAVDKPRLVSELSLRVLEEHEKRVGVQIRPVTQKQNAREHETLLRWIAEAYTYEGLAVQECRKIHFETYKEWLLSQGLLPSTTKRFLRWFAQVMRKAVALKLIKVYPFREVSYPKVCGGEPRFLSKTELRRLVELRPRLWGEPREALDLFLLCCFTGMAFGDATHLCPSDIKEDARGRRYIHKRRVKTGVEFIVPVGRTAWLLLQRSLMGSERDKPLFSLNYHQVSKTLHSLALGCEISRLTFHMARHTFATLSIEAGVSTETLARMMGHRSLLSTQIYGRITEEKVAKEMREKVSEIG